MVVGLCRKLCIEDKELVLTDILRIRALPVSAAGWFKPSESNRSAVSKCTLRYGHVSTEDNEP